MMRRLLIVLVRGYQLFIGSWLRSSCRFHPSCSGYAIEALERHGPLAGTYLAAARIVRCGPWCAGGDDPVPAQWPRAHGSDPSAPRPALFSHLIRPTPKKNS